MHATSVDRVPSVETERQKVTKDEGISGLPKQNNPTTLPGHVDPRTHEGKLFNSWRFSGDGSCHEETPFSPGSTSTCHARSQGNLAHSTRSRRNKRLNGKQDTTKVLRASPNPAAHGVGTTSPRQGRLKPTASIDTGESASHILAISHQTVQELEPKMHPVCRLLEESDQV